jgi:endonuclease YncB( thermonuclease family)
MTDAWRHQRMSRAQTLTFWLLFLAVIFAPLQASAATLTGKVVKVADGDTITILVGTERHRVRLQGIDAPERKQYRRAA